MEAGAREELAERIADLEAMMILAGFEVEGGGDRSSSSSASEPKDSDSEGDGDGDGDEAEPIIVQWCVELESSPIKKDCPSPSAVGRSRVGRHHPKYSTEHRDDHDVIGWDMEPGDVLLFGPVVCHGSAGNASNKTDRRVLAFRYCGPDVTYAPRHATMPLLWDHGLEPGDHLAGNLFPQVWPRLINHEIERRMQDPEPPSEKQIGAFMQHLADSGFGPDGQKRTLFEAAES